MTPDQPKPQSDNVLYGNIVGANRQDFEKYCGDGLQPLGKFAIAGFAEERTAFGLCDEDKELQ